MNNWKQITLALGLLAFGVGAGCEADTPQTTPQDAKIIAAVRALDVDITNKAALSCVVEMVQAGYFRRYAWTPSDNGLAATYNVEARFVVRDTTALLIPGDKARLQIRAQGVSAAGTVGPWSEWSDVINPAGAPSAAATTD